MKIKLKRNIAISDSGFIFDPASGDSFSVNPIGAEMLTLLKENKTQEEVKSYILANYNTDEAGFEKDYYDFLNMLLQYHLADKDEADKK